MKELQWDGAVNHLEVQALGPMTATNEMASSLDTIVIHLKADTAYKRKFVAAFGSPLINTQRILKALSQFVGSIVSSDSKYDKVKRGQAKFTVWEENGYNLFKTNCSGCHSEPLFTDNTFRNNGLALNAFTKDYGRMKVSGNPADSLKFKVPSLRNVAVTFPYMHDGRLYSLQSVLEHYTTGISAGPTLDTILLRKIIFNKVQKMQLIAFLNALTDSTLLHDKRLGPN